MNAFTSATTRSPKKAANIPTGSARIVATTKLFSNAAATLCSVLHRIITMNSQEKLNENATRACFLLFFDGTGLVEFIFFGELCDLASPVFTAGSM